MHFLKNQFFEVAWGLTLFVRLSFWIRFELKIEINLWTFLSIFIWISFFRDDWKKYSPVTNALWTSYVVIFLWKVLSENRTGTVEERRNFLSHFDELSRGKQTSFSTIKLLRSYLSSRSRIKWPPAMWKFHETILNWFSAIQNWRNLRFSHSLFRCLSLVFCKRSILAGVLLSSYLKSEKRRFSDIVTF